MSLPTPPEGEDSDWTPPSAVGNPPLPEAGMIPDAAASPFPDASPDPFLPREGAHEGGADQPPAAESAAGPAPRARHVRWIWRAVWCCLVLFLASIAPMIIVDQFPHLEGTPVLMGPCLVVATASFMILEVIGLVAGYIWIARGFKRAFGIDLPERLEVAGPEEAASWKMTVLSFLGIMITLLAVLGLVILLAFEGMFALFGLAMNTDAKRVTVDGQAWWVEHVWLDEGCWAHREVNIMLMEKDSRFDDYCSMLGEERPVAGVGDLRGGPGEESTDTVTPTPEATLNPQIFEPPAAQETQDSPAAGGPFVIDKEGLDVFDARHHLGITKRDGVVARNEGGRWWSRGTINSTGEPTALICSGDHCLAGMGTANGGEVWTTSDDGATWNEAQLPTGMNPNETFVHSATRSDTGWNVCLGYPDWVQSDDAPTCIDIP